MTEDGRSSEAAALCGFGPRLFEVWGNRDAQSDAIANSLRLRESSNFALLDGNSSSFAPNRTANRVFLPILQIFKENRYENLPGK